jgi:hypothetical protein
LKPNIGLLDRSVRLVSGLVVFGSAMQMNRQSVAKTALLTYGAMKITEGVTGWCPIMYAMGIRDIETSTQSTGQLTPSTQEDAPVMNSQRTARNSDQGAHDGPEEAHTVGHDEHAHQRATEHNTATKQRDHGDRHRDHQSEHAGHDSHSSSDERNRSGPKTSSSHTAHPHVREANAQYH